MSHHLDPLILQKLAAFAQRRRKLIIFRGLCAALATLLLTMMVIALIDRLFRLPDAVRWGLSLVAYATVIVVEWRSCVRLLLHAPGPRRLARLVEHAEPRLREDLLSAVELGDAGSDAAFDSEQFRALLQSDVAQRMEGLNVERLLPVNLVRRYIGVAIVIFVACIAAFALSGGQFGTLLLRALAPGANLDRVSRVKVKIVQPVSPDMVVAQGETIPLVIELAGQRAHTAEVELITPAGTERVKMSAIGPDRFSASIQVGREDVLYRISAGDAVTKKYRLHAVPRPHVVKFDKTYLFPAYARVAPKKASDEHGDLAALEGTEVELRLQTNQRVKDGELRVEQGKKSTVIKLAAEGDQLVGKVPLDASGTYRVQLVSAETGFENKFSPEYELRAEPDLVPQVELELPKQDLILAANEMVDVRGTAKDDQSLAKVLQLVKVNDGKWQEVSLAQEPGAQAEVERRWDLYAQGVKPGDLITTKLVAIDLKGSRGESRPLQISITKSGFEAKRLEALEAQRALYETLKALRTAGDVLEKRSNEARDQFERLPEGDAQRRIVAIGAGAPGDLFLQQSGAAWAQFIATVKAAEAGHAAAHLVPVGRLLSRLDAGFAQYGKEALGLVAAEPEAPAARELMREFAEANARAAQQARFVEERFRPLLFSQEVQVIAENVQVVAREQERLAELAQNSGDDPAKWASLADRLRVVLSEARSLEALMIGSALRGSGDRLKQAAQRLQKQREAVERVLSAGAPGKSLLDPIQKLSKVTAENVRVGFDMVRDQTSQANKAQTEILRDLGPIYANFERLRQELQLVMAAEKLPAETRAARTTRRWELRGLLFKQHGDAEEARVDGDAEFVNDLRTVNRALEGIRMASAEAERETTNGRLTRLDMNFRLLENAHHLADTLNGLAQLRISERWEITSLRSRSANVCDWRWIESRMRQLPDELGKMKLEGALRPLVEQAQRLLWDAQKLPEWKSANEEMNRRADTNRAPVTMIRELELVAAPVRQALDLLRKPIEQAREQIAELAPKLSELMAQLAKETDALKKETEEQATQTAEKTPDEAQKDAQQVLAQQQQLNDRVEALKDAVRAEANRQDILTEQGRATARDADDALALLKEPPPKAEAALADATQAQLPSAKSEALTEAVKEQQKLSDALHLLAQHFENVEQGQPDDTRMALRATEEATGIKAEMEQQYERAGQLAEMAQQSPEEMLKKLEAALPQSPSMQKELSQISQDTLSNAQTKLAEAAQSERQVAQHVDELAKQPPTPSPQAAAGAKEAAKQAVAAAQAAREAANEAVQAANKANNPEAADQARHARAEAEEAKEAAEEAAQAAEQMSDPKRTAQAAQTATQKAGEAAQNAKEAAKAAEQAQATAQQTAAQQNGEQQANNQQTSKEAGEAVQAAQMAAEAAMQAKAAIQQAAAPTPSAQMAQNASAPNASSPTAPQPSPGTPPAPPANPQLAQAEQQQQPIAENAAQAGAEVARAGRHEERLMNAPAGQQLQQLGAEIAETAAMEIPAAQQALGQAQQAAQAQGAVNAANQELSKELGQLQAAANQPATAPASPATGQAIPAAPTAQAQTAAQNPAGQTPAGSQLPPPAAAQAGSTPPAQMGVAPASPEEQLWMARTLDALDAVIHAPPTAMTPDAQGQQAQASQAGQQAQSAQGQQSAAQAQQSGAQAMAQAQQAMAAAAQAASSAMRAQRSETPSETPGAPASSSRSAVSKGGAQAEADGLARGALPEARNKAGDWGKLPKKMAEQLTRGQNENVAGEYRHQVETYYRVIAEKSKKP